MTFLNANTSSSSRGRSSVEGAPGYAGSNPYRSRFHNRLRATNRVSEEDEAQWGRGLDVDVYSGATAAGELHEGSGGCEQHRSAAVRSSASALMSRIWEIPNADMGYVPILLKVVANKDSIS